jgi:hypothetical protein
MANTKNKQQQLTEAQNLAVGIPKYAGSMTFTYNGQTYSASQAAGVFQGIVSAILATQAAKAAYHESVVKEDALLATSEPLATSFKEVLRASFEAEPTIMGGLGIAQRKTPTPPTAQELASRAAKAKATREARGTGSKKQKAQITGNVEGVTITPVVATPAPSATAAPAGTSPAATATPHS